LGEEGKQMTTKKEVNLRRKWRKQLKKIGQYLGVLLTTHSVFESVHNISMSNKRIRSPKLFYDLLRNNYLISITIGINKLGNYNSKGISLYNLIKDIKEHPKVITREYFVSGYRKQEREYGMADADFNRFANKKNDFLSIRKLHQDLVRLVKELKIVKTFRDKWIAHLDTDRKRYKKPTYNDIAKALKVVDDLWSKYNLLLNRVERTSKPVLQYDWKEPLRHAWIEGEQKK
jgi:hypothetical protein